MQQNWWEAAPIVGPAPAAGGLRPITAPRPREPAPVRPVQEALDQQQLENARLETRRKEQEIAEAARKAGPAPQDLEAVRYNLLNVVAKAREAKKLSKERFFATGIGQGIASQFGGTAASDVQGLMNTIGANTAFEKLAELRAQSPTGGALGAISEGEMKLLRDSIASLDPSQSDNAFQAQMDKIIEHYGRIYQKAGGDPALLRSLEERNTLFQEKLRNGADLEEMKRYAAELGLQYNEDELKAAIGKKNAVIVGKPPEGPGLLEQFGDATINTVAGLGQGAAAIVDIPAKALGAILSVPADMLGLDGVAEDLRNTRTIGGEIEKAAPTPQDWAGWSARQASALGGGGLTFGPKASNALAEIVVGKVPPAPSALATVAPRTPSIAKDMADMNITPRPALTGGAGARTLSAISEATPVGAFLHQRAGARLTDEGSRALSNIASREGRAVNAETAGEIAAKGALAYRANSRNAISRLYDQAASVSGGVKVVPERTVKALTRHISELGENPAADASLPYLTNLRDKLVNEFADGVTVQGIRGMRTSLRDQFYKEGLRGTDIERRVMDAIDSVSDDLAESLGAAGKSEAASLFRQADTAWAERVKTLDNIVMPILGKKGEKTGEQVFRALEQTAKGGGIKLKRFLASLPDQEAQTTRASLIEALGRASPGGTDDFSLANFLTRWRDMGPTAKEAFFTTDARQSIDKLARVAERAKLSGRYLNASRSGAVAIGAGTFATALDSVGTLGMTLAAQTGTGLLLTNPSVAKALSAFASASSRPQAVAAVRQLGAATRHNPALAEQVTDLQAKLLAAMNDSAPITGRLAASPDERPREQ